MFGLHTTISDRDVLLHTLPQFHANGWGMPYDVTGVGGRRRQLIVAGGGAINADASDLLVELAEVLDAPVIPTLMGWGTIPDDHRLMAGMAGLQTS